MQPDLLTIPPQLELFRGGSGEASGSKGYGIDSVQPAFADKKPVVGFTVIDPAVVELCPGRRAEQQQKGDDDFSHGFRVLNWKINIVFWPD
jgi:hypothetical protein